MLSSVKRCYNREGGTIGMVIEWCSDFEGARGVVDKESMVMFKRHEWKENVEVPTQKEELSKNVNKDPALPLC